jgi:hypothetical protein
MAKGARIGLLFSVVASLLFWRRANPSNFVVTGALAKIHGVAALGSAGEPTPALVATPLQDAAENLALSSMHGPVTMERRQVAAELGRVFEGLSYDDKLLKLVRQACRTVLTANTDKFKQVLRAIDRALDDAVASKGLRPPEEDIRAIANHLATSAESGDGSAFQEMLNSIEPALLAKPLAQYFVIDDGFNEAWERFVAVAATTKFTGDAVATGPPQTASAATEAAAVNFAGTLHSIAAAVNDLGGARVGTNFGKAIEITFSVEDGGKLLKCADSATEALIATPDANIHEVLKALVAFIEAAEQSDGLVQFPPSEAFERLVLAVANSCASVMSVHPSIMSGFVTSVVEAYSSSDKIKVLAYLGDSVDLAVQAAAHR